MQIMMSKQDSSFLMVKRLEKKKHLRQYAFLFMLDVIMTHERSGGKLREPLALTPDGGELSDSSSGIFNSWETAPVSHRILWCMGLRSILDSKEKRIFASAGNWTLDGKTLLRRDKECAFPFDLATN